VPSSAATLPPIEGAAAAPAAAPAALPARTRTIPREFAFMLAALVMIGDLLASCLAVFAGLQLREWQRLGAVFDSAHHPIFNSFVITWSVAGGALYVLLLAALKTYETDNLYRVRRWFKNAIKAAIIWSVVIWAFIGVFRIEEFSPRIGVVYCMITLMALLAMWRLVSFIFLIQPRVKEAASLRVIVVGWNDRAAHLRQWMRRDLAQLQEIIGCVPMPNGEFSAHPPHEVAVLGDYSSLPRLVAECQADAVILSDVSCSSQEIQRLITFCQREMLNFQLVPEYFPALNSGLQVQTMSGVPLLGVRELPLDRTVNRSVKRVMDVAGSLVGLAIAALVIPPFALLVLLESPGPIIYRQLRTSRSGRTFYIYKIRSMRVNAEAQSGAVWCTREDPRRLKIGTFMRRLNIDELPQFWNVLIGDMSLVGPRPERPELIEKFKDTIPNYNARHEVRTAITGWAQIQGLRGDTDLKKRIEADLYYLENWSPLLDLYCIAATLFKVKNAH
jgi:exopolysaccharide biosynthesis polyprenyl glycosylphosphotransferase